MLIIKRVPIMEDADDLFHRCDYHCLNQWQSRQLSISAIWIVFSLCHLPSGVNIEPSINRNQYHLLQQQSQVEGLWKVIEHYLVSYIHHNLHQQQACTSRYFLNIQPSLKCTKCSWAENLPHRSPEGDGLLVRNVFLCGNNHTAYSAS